MKTDLKFLDKVGKVAIFNNVVYTRIPKEYKTIPKIATFTFYYSGYAIADTKEQMDMYPDFIIQYLLDNDYSKIGYQDNNVVEYMELDEYIHDHSDKLLKEIKAGTYISFGCSTYVALGKVTTVNKNQIVIVACKTKNRVVVDIPKIKMITRNISPYKAHDTIDIFCECEKQDFFREEI